MEIACHNLRICWLWSETLPASGDPVDRRMHRIARSFPIMNLLKHSLLTRPFLCCASLCVLLSFSARPTAAQQTAPNANAEKKPASDLETRQVDLTLEDQPLAAIIAALSDQIGHGIVLDGRPLLSKASFRLHNSAKSALDQIAEGFDCSWKVGKSGAILMSKRFHQPGDLPQMHLKEMQKMAADLLTIWPENASNARMSSYPFAAAPVAPGNALYRTLTREQHQILRSGSPLTFQDLSPEQKDLVRLGILTGAAGNSHDVWQGLNARLANMSQSYLQWRSWFHGPLDTQPTPFQYSLEYIWPDLQDRGFDRLVSAGKVYEATGEQFPGKKVK
jgi:hypothetical protein